MNCSICLCNLYKEKIIILECSHVYHINCIQEWLLKSRTCPLCRFHIKDITEIVPFYLRLLNFIIESKIINSFIFYITTIIIINADLMQCLMYILQISIHYYVYYKNTKLFGDLFIFFYHIFSTSVFP